MCRVSVFQNPRQAVPPVTDTENFQNHFYEVVPIVLTIKKSSDEDTQVVSSCHLLKQTSQAATGVDLARQAPVQPPGTGCKTHEPQFQMAGSTDWQWLVVSRVFSQRAILI